MLSFAPAPIFSASTWDHHRPSVPSPLSSSPIRASSPLSPVDRNTLPSRQSQSSPLQPSKSKFAARPTRPNPVLRRREEVHEARRRNFLQSVRQKSEDKAWQRRDIEGQFLKTSWMADVGYLSFDAPTFSEADIEDAMAFNEEVDQPQEDKADDDMILDEPGEDELEAMLASYEELRSDASRRPPSPTISDHDHDHDYDDIFAEILSQEQTLQQRSRDPLQEMDMSDDSYVML